MKKIVLIIFLLPVITGLAQNKNLSFYHLSVENGLPKRTANHVIQDKYGYIWAATGAGLVRYDGYNTKVYLTKLGIGPLSQPSEIYQDHEGELWVGTFFKGMFWYDRAADTFRQCIYFPGDSAANYIIAIQEDGSGNIWAISKVPGAATKYFVICLNKKTGKWQYFSNSDSGSHHIGATNFYSLAEDHTGNIWMTTNNGVYEYDSAANQFKEYMILKPPFWYSLLGLTIFCEFPSEPGILYMNYFIYRDTATGKSIEFEKGIIRFNENDHTFKKYQLNSNVWSNGIFAAREDKENRLWLGTENGIALFNRKAGTFTNYSVKAERLSEVFDPFKWHLLEDKDGNLWYSNGYKGFFYFNTTEKTFTHYLANPDDPASLHSNVIYGLLKDKTGTLWLSEETGGLQWINKAASLFTVYPNKSDTKNNYSYGSVSCYAEDTDQNIWLGTTKGLVHWNRHTNSFKLIKPFHQQFFAEHISCILIDKNGLIWYGAEYGLFCYDLAKGTVKNYIPKKIFIPVVNCIYEDHEGIIWIGTNYNGLCSLNPATGKFTQYPYRSSSIIEGQAANGKELSSQSVISIYEDMEKNIWIGTNSGGLNRFNRKDSTFTAFMDQPKGFTRERTIREDRNGLLWLGTWGGGLFHFNPTTDTMQQFTEKDGLLFNAVYSCLQDSSGMFWLTSPRGITRFDPATGSVHLITTANGLPAVHIDYGGFRTREGDFLVSTSNGFFEFNPDQITPDSDPPIMNIEKISFNTPQKGNKLSGDSTFSVFGHSKFDLRYNENRITFHYVGIHYQNAAMTQYAYKLDEYDKSWIQAGTDRSVTYTNLSPGTYIFYVKAANSDGAWSKAASIIIIIHPPWWKIWWAYLIYALLIISIVWGFIAYRSVNLKRKNRFLEQKVSERTDELKQSLDNLQSTQKQLIQSEKMASLGELTAGIAHEIQNPLNFVNNFSEVNKEMLEELKAERSKPDAERDESLENEIINDVIENEEKINHHGRRADAIVKGMLQHSRVSAGVKEPTDINALADEYLRLSYHGMRAKDKDFNATMNTDFDSSIGKINIIPQDIGRVLLNLINNAFYAVDEKKKQLTKDLPGFQNLEGLQVYEPTVSVKTSLNPPLEGREAVTITVSDNGNGIPKEIVDKIFQPFFTTKPTGQGTGLGLSLSYDIVKAHGGEIKVESKEGEGTEFLIQLPFKESI